jgi:amidase
LTGDQARLLAGTSAAVSASFAALGYGSDTCGSIRVPAAFTASFGLRPTKGLTSIAGIMPLAHTQDVVGPIARTVSDLAIGPDAIIGGPDPADSATGVLVGRSLPRFVESLRTDALSGARIGILTNFLGNAPEDAEVGAIVREALRKMREAGVDVVEVSLPGLEELLTGTSVIATEFKFDLLDYLAAIPDSPVTSLDEIVSGKLHHPAVATQLRASNAIVERDSEAYRSALNARWWHARRWSVSWNLRGLMRWPIRRCAGWRPS